MPDLLLCQACAVFEAQSDGELSMKAGSHVMVCSKEFESCDGWIMADATDGTHGYVPRAYLREVVPVTPVVEPRRVASGDGEDLQLEEVDDGSPSGLDVTHSNGSHFGSLVNTMTKAKKHIYEKSAVSIFFQTGGTVAKLCLRAKNERLKHGLTRKAKDQILKKFFQKRPDLQEHPLSHYDAKTETPFCIEEKERRQHRAGVILLEVLYHPPSS